MKLRIWNGKVYICLALGAIIFALYFVGNQLITPFSITPKAVFAQTSASCQLKKFGDANCDGIVDITDYEIWLKQYDKMVSPYPIDNNANYMCVSKNTTTYFADLTDYEIWRRHAASGLITPTEGPTDSPSPTLTVNPTNTPPVDPTNTPVVVNPTNTPVPPTGSGPTSPPPPPPRQGCSGDGDCPSGYCCASGGHCWPNGSPEC